MNSFPQKDHVITNFHCLFFSPTVVDQQHVQSRTFGLHAAVSQSCGSWLLLPPAGGRQQSLRQQHQPKREWWGLDAWQHGASDAVGGVRGHDGAALHASQPGHVQDESGRVDHAQNV